MMGWTRNSRNEPQKMVSANSCERCPKRTGAGLCTAVVGSGGPAAAIDSTTLASLLMQDNIGDLRRDVGWPENFDVIGYGIAAPRLDDKRGLLHAHGRR